MIFQEPKTALNPVLNIGFQIAEAIAHAYNINQEEALGRVEKVLREVEMADPAIAAKKYPHELSGGMAQRVLIGMALSTEPKLLIADEPTSSLDVSVQSQIMKLINRLIEERRISVLLITHNLGVVAENCSKVGVMYAGNVVECADVKTIFADPAHPYTKGLIDVVKMRGERGKLSTISGLVPDLVDPPTGCRFHPRCQHAMPICQKSQPKNSMLTPGHSVSCFLYEA
jgi:peptide/nickel transport system ATP-binding protein